MHHSESDKARHYLDLVDTARCSGQWQDIPELTRKIGKHAPQRQCLIVTAQTERMLAEQLRKRLGTTSISKEISAFIPILINAIENEKVFKEDGFQAQICLARLYNELEDKGHTLSTLPSRMDQVPGRFASEGGVTARWTHVCILQGTYTTGNSLQSDSKISEACQLYESMLPYISKVPPAVSNMLEFQTWTERVLSHYCMLSHRYIAAHGRQPRDLLTISSEMSSNSILAPFRAYAQNWGARNAGGSDKSGISYQTWNAYYDTLSVLIQHDVVQPIFETRRDQVIELRAVESTYETLLLQAVSFPRADQASSLIDHWVDQVIANWRAVCGSRSRDEDLGEGGRVAFGRGVLEILYRAATRTFHSTRVLRHLFTVHASLGEVYLASKAVDSYLEILVRAKGRAEKSGEAEIGLDDDSTALGTAATSIKMLCEHGRREDVEKSIAIAKIVEEWLQKWHPASSCNTIVSANDVPEDLKDRSASVRSPVSGQALAQGYYALGVCQSSWARVTYETSSRTELQTKALVNFRAALDTDLGEEANVEILYSFAAVLAETRDIDAAIVTIKRALSSSTIKPKLDGVDATDFAPDTPQNDSDAELEYKGLLLRCWHLLALLLSVRQDYLTAVAACEAALDLYGSKMILYGDTRRLDTSTLAFSEKKTLMEIKMTQLALAEVTDGPEEAVNASGELLELYTKLFSFVAKPVPKIEEPSTSPPSSVNGTLRSLRGSILGLPKESGMVSRKTEPKGQNTTSSSLHSSQMPKQEMQPHANSSTGPETSSIQNERHHFHTLGRHGSNKLHKKDSRKNMGNQRMSRTNSPPRPSTSEGSHHHLNLHLPSRNRQKGTITTSNGSDETSITNGNQYASDEVGVAISHNLPSIPSTPAATPDPPNPLHKISSAAQNMNHRNPNNHPVPPKPPPAKNWEQKSTTTRILPLPEPHYPPAQQTRHALTLLTKIWLLISALYRRASMPVDAQGALSEATTHVQSIENTISTLDGSSTENFSTPAYGGLKASGELWADVLAEQAALHAQLGNLEQASDTYEIALGHWPDHVAATVGLCNILLDEYAAPPTTDSSPLPNQPPPPTPTLGTLPTSSPNQPTTLPTTPSDLFPRLAARDRAYGLLSALTKSGQGWDSSEAWFAFARACEESGLEEKAREALWWVVELEEGRGVRGWGCLR